MEMTWWLWLIVSFVPVTLMILMLIGLCRASSEADKQTQLAYRRVRSRHGDSGRHPR